MFALLEMRSYRGGWVDILTVRKACFPMLGTVNKVTVHISKRYGISAAPLVRQAPKVCNCFTSLSVEFSSSTAFTQLPPNHHTARPA